MSETLTQMIDRLSKYYLAAGPAAAIRTRAAELEAELAVYRQATVELLSKLTIPECEVCIPESIGQCLACLAREESADA